MGGEHVNDGLLVRTWQWGEHNRVRTLKTNATLIISVVTTTLVILGMCILFTSVYGMIADLF